MATRVRISEVRRVIREELEREAQIDSLCEGLQRDLTEATKYHKAAEKIADLARSALKDPFKTQSLMQYLRKIGAKKDSVKLVFDLIKKGNPVEVVAGVRDVACDVLGVRPSMTGSGQSDPCKPRAMSGKMAQMKMKAKGFIGKLGKGKKKKKK